MGKDLEVKANSEAAPSATIAVETEHNQFQMPVLDQHDAALVRAALRDPGALYFYDHNFLGKFLIRKNICTHPVIREKEKFAKKLEKLQAQFLLTGLADSPSAATKLAQSEPDFQPKNEDQITLECSLDRAIDAVVTNSIYSNQYENLLRHDFQEEFENQMGSLRDTTKLEALRAVFPEQLNERQYVFLRDQFLPAVVSGSYSSIFDLLQIFHQDKNWDLAIQKIMRALGPKLFANQKFQSAVTQGLIKTLVLKGERSFFSFAEYLSKLGLNLHENRLNNVPAEFISRQLETVWKRDPHRYYDVIDILLINGLTTSEALTRDQKVKLRTLQFLLYSFRQNKFRNAAREAVSLITETLQLHSPDDLIPARERVLWMEYRQICLQLNQQVDPELQHLYRQGRISRFGGHDED
ncbi:hypothetical protein IT411_00370 [Candidatus Peregrinibacteria bacterium]|nr:hypothetical protein [Candidatus Peregrinibacteria bacterium]